MTGRLDRFFKGVSDIRNVLYILTLVGGAIFTAGSIVQRVSALEREVPKVSELDKTQAVILERLSSIAGQQREILIDVKELKRRIPAR